MTNCSIALKNGIFNIFMKPKRIITMFMQSRALVVWVVVVVVVVFFVVVASPSSSKSLNEITFWHSSIFCPCECPRNVGALRNCSLYYDFVDGICTIRKSSRVHKVKKVVLH